MERLRQKQQILLSPKDYFNGKRLPEKFSAPDNILMFHHDFSSNREISHPRYTLVIPHGKMRYLIDSEEYSIQSGNALLIFPGQVRYLMQDSQCYSRLFITFDLPEKQEYIPLENLGKFGPDSIETLCKAIDLYHTGQSIRCSLELIKFFYSLSNMERPARQKRLHPTVAKALSVIHTHLSRRLPINVRQIAEKLNMSESNLRLLFHKTTGSSISDYIAEQRLETAQYHLLHSTLGIGEIAEICGYGSVYAFSAFFKKKTGESPRAFRNRSVHKKG